MRYLRSGVIVKTRRLRFAHTYFRWRDALSVVTASLFIGIGSAVRVEMVHSRSLCSRAARWSRAEERGYVQAAPSGARHILVPEEIAPRAKAQITALQLHAQAVASSHHPYHYLRTAARDPSVGSSERKLMEQANRDAARSRHSWQNVCWKHQDDAWHGGPGGESKEKWADLHDDEHGENKSVAAGDGRAKEFWDEITDGDSEEEAEVEEGEEEVASTLPSVGKVRMLTM